MRIDCPICKTVLEDAGEDFAPRPFCSTRCKMVDLGNWLTDVYRIEGPAGPDAQRDEELDLT